MKNVLSDIIGIIGASSVTYGVYMMSESFGYIAGGLFFMLFAFFISRE